MNTANQFKSELMRRIYFVYWLRRLRHSPTVKLVLAGGLVGLTGMVVSLKDVWSNALSSGQPLTVPHYLWSAFIHTELAIQALALTIALLSLFFLKDLFFRTSLAPVDKVA